MSDLGTNTVLVARKWVDRRAVVDPLTGVVHTDPRTSGASDADDAALEWGLRLAEAWDAQLAAVTAGPANAEAVLRQPVALGATKAFRVDVDRDADSFDVAVAISHVARKCGASVVVCGDLSIDRGTGAVPAFVAALLGTPQALGLVDLQPDPSARGKLRAWRRLDGGRREHLAVESPCVLSVEGGSARLRRAGLEGLLDARGS
ncbi:MAG TPA: mycofactocin-associated electron transfer flavoprotein beta subunit, partial [Acidimicrobiales bacterium]|nr:mycofactocin-associated electron transfer flavoprotein beta subunit [Acidimicrobiales bacterium]